MKLSVEISTFNRRDLLCLVLRGLARQTYPFDQFEAVFSDDGSTDGTTQKIESMRGSMPFPVRYLKHPNRGCGFTHNRGIRESRGHIVLMLADDIIPESQLLMEHMKSHEENPESSVAVVGKLRQSSLLPQTTFQRAWDREMNDFFPDGKIELDYAEFSVSNLSFKKDFMLANGMFREWPACSGEDLELAYRLKQKGMRVLFNPRAVGNHHHAETLDTVSNRAYAHGRNWHFLEDAVPDIWVRRLSGRFRLSDGVGTYCVGLMTRLLRNILIRPFLIVSVAVPLVRRADRWPFLSFAVPFLMKRIHAHAFRRGLKEHRANVAWRKEPGGGISRHGPEISR